MSIFRVLTVATQNYDAILAQIDHRLSRVFNGNPNSVAAADYIGIWGIDSTSGNLYVSTQADGTVGGTVWTLVHFNVVDATDVVKGIVKLADVSDVQAETDVSLVLTCYTAGQVYAKKGSNNDIDQLTGLTTPLSQSQGGTGYDFTDDQHLINHFLPDQSGNGQLALLTNGSGVQSWGMPSYPRTVINTTGVGLVAGKFHLIAASNITINLPTPSTTAPPLKIAFLPGVTNITLDSGSGNKIMQADRTLVFDGYNLPPTEWMYVNSTYGWWRTG